MRIRRMQLNTLLNIVSLALVMLLLPGCDQAKGKLYEVMTSAGYKAASLERKEVQVGDHTIAYVERKPVLTEGQAAPAPIVLVHGFGANKENWLEMVMEIPDSWPVVALDLPAFGESTYLDDAGYDLNQQADRLNDFLEEAGIGQANLVGNSMGGGIIIWLALSHPEKVASLTLMNSVGLDDPNTQSDFEKDFAEGRNPLIVNNVEDFDSMIEYATVKPPFIPWPVSAVLAEQAVERKDRLDRVFKQLNAKVKLTDPDYLQPITAPTLVMWGEKDRLLHVTNATLLAENLTNSKLVVYENIGHAPMIEVPEQSAQDIVAFIEGESSIP